MSPDTAFVDKLNDQIGNEFAAHQQYVAIAVHYDGQTLPRLAAFFYRQAVEERGHAMMMLRYLIDSGAPVRIPALPEPECDFDDLAAPVRLALEQEREVAGQISELARVARDAGDYPSEQFTQWFLKEQVEEVSSMSALLRVVERAGSDPMRAEDYLARETIVDPNAGPDPTAPAEAGAG